MTVAQGAPLLLEIFEFCKCNPHLKRNIENIISALIHEYITTGNNNNLDVLNNALSSTRAYDQYVVSALKGADEDEDRMLCIVFSSNKNRFNALRNRIASKSQVIYNQFAAIESKIEEIEVQLELSHVVECVNNQSMSKCDALERVYNLYKSNKSNDIVCENLATLIPMCIIEYVIHENNGHYKVETIIQELKSNMSQTFRNHKDQIGQAYNRIWNQLSSDARFYIQNSPQNLTESGKALLRGLNYLKALS
jgi:RecG-like helicase